MLLFIEMNSKESISLYLSYDHIFLEVSYQKKKFISNISEIFHHLGNSFRFENMVTWYIEYWITYSYLFSILTITSNIGDLGREMQHFIYLIWLNTISWKLEYFHPFLRPHVNIHFNNELTTLYLLMKFPGT